MPQFDVHQSQGETAKLAPYLVVLQSDVLSALDIAVIAPLRPADDFGPEMKRLHVPVDFRGERHIISPEEMFSLPRVLLGAPAGSLAHAHVDIIAALDFLFTGH